MSRPAPFAFFAYFSMVKNRPCTARAICFYFFKLHMHKIRMFEILSRCFLESFHFQEKKTTQVCYVRIRGKVGVYAVVRNVIKLEHI